VFRLHLQAVPALTIGCAVKKMHKAKFRKASRNFLKVPLYNLGLSSRTTEKWPKEIEIILLPETKNTIGSNEKINIF
jgi:hypothetical protein